MPDPPGTSARPAPAGPPPVAVGPAVVDSHCHLADEAFAADLDAVATRAREAGVGSALCILSADEPAEVARTGVVRAAWPAVEFSAGVHPHRAGGYEGRPEDAAAAAREAIRTTGARAVGEIGLDYHYDFAPREVQRQVLAAQLTLAVDLDRPVVIHMREAVDDTLGLLRDAGAGLRGVLHCFSETRDVARRALDLGFYLSLSGILTFPKAGALRELAAFVPADRLLVETDAPFLAPVPHRGRRNEPAWVRQTLVVLAGARGEPVDDLASSVSRNFAALLGTHG